MGLQGAAASPLGWTEAPPSEDDIVTNTGTCVYIFNGVRSRVITRGSFSLMMVVIGRGVLILIFGVFAQVGYQKQTVIKKLLKAAHIGCLKSFLCITGPVFSHMFSTGKENVPACDGPLQGFDYIK